MNQFSLEQEERFKMKEEQTESKKMLSLLTITITTLVLSHMTTMRRGPGTTMVVTMERIGKRIMLLILRK